MLDFLYFYKKLVHQWNCFLQKPKKSRIIPAIALSRFGGLAAGWGGREGGGMEGKGKGGIQMRVSELAERYCICI